MVGNNSSQPGTGQCMGGLIVEASKNNRRREPNDEDDDNDEDEKHRPQQKLNLLVRMEDDRITRLLRQAEIVAAGREDGGLAGTHSAEAGIEEVYEDGRMAELQAKISHLEKQLKAKDEVCKKLEGCLEKVLNSYPTREDLSKEHFQEAMQLWSKQVWFKKPVPVLVDSHFEQLRQIIEREYTDGRRTSYTMIECQRLVDNIRAKWEVDLPAAVKRVLNADNKVFSTAIERNSNSSPGQVCEAVHFLVYLVYRLYNRAAHVLHTTKKQEDVSETKSKLQAVTCGTEDSEFLSDIGDLKWYNNPYSSLNVYLTSARRTVKSAVSLKDAEECGHAITLSVAQLVGTSKPKLNDSLQYIASIISLKELAMTKGWVISGKFNK